jgi:hypothetical protein
MTAYSAEHKIQGEGIPDYIRLEFSTKNFIEKGNEADFERLKSTIDNINILNLQLENREYLQILRKNINEKAADSFLTILTTPNDNKEQIRANLTLMRIIYESIIDVCAKKIPGMGTYCGNEKGGDTIIWMSDNKYIDNYVLRNFLFSIRKISNVGCHPDDKDPLFDPTSKDPLYKPTSDTVNALIYALKDVIRWFKEICSIHI